MSIGGDQGGSIRIPSCYCGTFGMKPTFGLVPYSGVFPIEHTIDHVGPITATVFDNALLLEVIAGPDGLDDRQHIPSTVKFNYTQDIDKGVKNLKIGILTEGFELPDSEKIVNESVREAAKVFTRLGATVSEVSVPMHSLGGAIWTPIALEGAVDQMMLNYGYGTGHKGLYVTSLIDVYNGWRKKANQLADSVKVSILTGQYMRKFYGGHYYAKAQNLGRMLSAAYDEAFKNVDLLLMPTLPLRATPLPKPDDSRELYIKCAFEMLANTCPFDVTGHPAMNIPVNKHEDLPIGMMLVGKHFDELTIYKAAFAFEKAQGISVVKKLQN